MNKDNFFDFLTVNKSKDKRIESGFRYVEGPNISFQGLNSEKAFRQAFELAAKMKLDLEVRFRWQAKDKAAYPNREGIFRT